VAKNVKLTERLALSVKRHDLIHVEVVIDLPSIIFSVDAGKVFVDKAQRKVLKLQGLDEAVVDAFEALVRERWLNGEMPNFDIRPVVKLKHPLEQLS